MHLHQVNEATMPETPVVFNQACPKGGKKKLKKTHVQGHFCFWML